MTITVDLSCSKKNITSVCVNSLGDGIQIEEIIIRPNELKPATVVFTKPTYGGGFEVYYKVLKQETSKEFDDSHYRTFHLSVYHYKNRVVSANSFVEVTLTTPWECACLDLPVLLPEQSQGQVSWSCHDPSTGSAFRCGLGGACMGSVPFQQRGPLLCT